MNRNKLISAAVIISTMALMFYLAVRQPSGVDAPVGEASQVSLHTAPFEDTAPGGGPETTADDPQHSGVVGRNESFFDLMQKCGFEPLEITEIAGAAKPVYNFRRIYPGQSYEIFTGPDGSLRTMRFAISDKEFIEVSSGEDGLSVARKEYPYQLVIKQASGLITHSLFASLAEQGLPVDLGIKLADIFAWDIDFFSQIRKNDYFRVIYEEKIMLGGPDDSGEAGVGRILAAEFNTSGENHYAFLFDNHEDFADYFDEKGKSLRKQLLRAPLTYSRISSNYSHRRLHPVKHTYQPHLGIDYAAPTGTPVMSTGAGTVMTASRTRANGNYLKVRHNSNYISYYLHLSRFAKGIRKGVKVKQGQVIGYVGATGIASGPHLDYRVKKNGRFVNPRKLKLPPAEPVASDRMDEYRLLADAQAARLSRIPIKDPRGEYFAGGEDAYPPSPADPQHSASD